jgi:hypothetical protein
MATTSLLIVFLLVVLKEKQFEENLKKDLNKSVISKIELLTLPSIVWQLKLKKLRIVKRKSTNHLIMVEFH